MKLLLTGFDPFAGEKVNPSWEAVRELEKEGIDGVEIQAICLPTVFGQAIEIAVQAIEEKKPDLVICVGQAGGRSEISLERVAININDAQIKDNKGQQPVDEPVIPGGPVGYWSTLPIKAMVRAIRETGIPAGVSNTAGTFVCNNIMFGILHHIAQKKLGTRAGFIHIPFLPEQAVNHPGRPSMTLDAVVRGLKTAIMAAVNCEEDEKNPEGKTH